MTGHSPALSARTRAAREDNRAERIPIAEAPTRTDESAEQTRYPQPSPLVSIIVATKNEEDRIGTLLRSILAQSYRHLEVLVVDNFSTDRTADIARSLGVTVLQWGPERSAQRNKGVSAASGTFVFILDADMELRPDIVAECVRAAAANPRIKAAIVPEESVGDSYWAQCRAIERRCYIGDDSVEAARFFDRSLFLELGGYATDLVGGEDWDLSDRARRRCQVARTRSMIIHHEGNVSPLRSFRKRRYYATTSIAFARRNPAQSLLFANMIFRPAYIRSWSMLVRQPHLLFGMMALRFCEVAGALVGFMVSVRASVNTPRARV